MSQALKKALKALRRIRDLLEDKYGLLIYVIELHIIETALKDYEYQTQVFKKITEPKLQTLSKKEIKQLKKSNGYITEYKGIYVDENTNKKLEALEIIIKKDVEISWFKYCSSMKEYNEWGIPSYKQLTKEEFKILKEVLQ